MLKPRNRELLGLIPSALLVTAGFTAIFIQQENSSLEASTNVTLNRVSSLSLTYGLLFLGLCLAAHLVIRFALPYADPYLFPLAAVLASVGIVMVYRINPSLARQQAQWMVLGLILFAVTILWLRRTGIGVLERYRYTIAAVGIVMAVLPRFPVIGEQVNGSYLDIHFGSVSFQPAEFAKVAIVIFLASYLRDNRQILVTAGRRMLGLDSPADEAVRADARCVGGGDGHAVAHGRAWNLADVLWSVPRAAVRRNWPLLVPVDRARAVWPGCLVRGRTRRARPCARACLGRSTGTEAVPQSASATSLASRCSPRRMAVCSGPALTSRC